MNIGAEDKVIEEIDADDDGEEEKPKKPAAKKAAPKPKALAQKKSHKSADVWDAVVDTVMSDKDFMKDEK